MVSSILVSLCCHAMPQLASATLPLLCLMIRSLHLPYLQCFATAFSLTWWLHVPSTAKWQTRDPASHAGSQTGQRSSLQATYCFCCWLHAAGSFRRRTWLGATLSRLSWCAISHLSHGRCLAQSWSLSSFSRSGVPPPVALATCKVCFWCSSLGLSPICTTCLCSSSLCCHGTGHDPCPTWVTQDFSVCLTQGPAWTLAVQWLLKGRAWLISNNCWWSVYTSYCG